MQVSDRDPYAPPFSAIRRPAGLLRLATPVCADGGGETAHRLSTLWSGHLTHECTPYAAHIRPAKSGFSSDPQRLQDQAVRYDGCTTGVSEGVTTRT